MKYGVSFESLKSDIIECRYNTVQYKMTILYVLLQWLRQNTNQRSNTGKTNGQAMGVFCEDFGENLPCYNGTSLYMLSTYQYSAVNCCVAQHVILDQVIWKLEALLLLLMMIWIYICVESDQYSFELFMSQEYEVFPPDNRFNLLASNPKKSCQFFYM